MRNFVVLVIYFLLSGYLTVVLANSFSSSLKSHIPRLEKNEQNTKELRSKDIVKINAKIRKQERLQNLKQKQNIARRKKQ